jgi:hypothetical protein
MKANSKTKKRQRQEKYVERKSMIRRGRVKVKGRKDRRVRDRKESVKRKRRLLPVVLRREALWSASKTYTKCFGMNFIRIPIALNINAILHGGRTKIH